MLDFVLHCTEIKTSQQETPPDVPVPMRPSSLVSLVVSGHDEGNRRKLGLVPNGVFQLGHLPPEVSAQFQLGKKYRVTLEELP